MRDSVQLWCGEIATRRPEEYSTQGGLRVGTDSSAMATSLLSGRWGRGIWLSYLFSKVYQDG